MLRVTADSNIYISALLNGNGSPARLLALAREGEIRLFVSDAILDEVSDVLSRKFHWPDADIKEVREEIAAFTQKVNPAVSLNVVKDDPDDDRILECASSAGADYIVSGDKDLLRLGWYDSIRILTVVDFLEQERKPGL